MTDTRALAGVRKKRGVPKGSITRPSNRITDLEANPDAPGTNERARQWLTKLDTLDLEFKTLHFEVIDIVDDQDAELLELNLTSMMTKLLRLCLAYNI